MAEFIGSTEVCKRLGIPRTELTRRIQLGLVKPSGKLPGVSGAYLWDAAYIDQLAANRSADKPAEPPPSHVCDAGCSSVPYDARDAH